jgi:hypothetical protein
VAGSYGLRAIAWAKRELGLTAGPWQARSIRKILRHDAAGDLVHRIALVSTGRQNGKSVIVRTVTGWFLDEGQHLEPFKGWTTILAAAHDAKQARIVYQGVGRDIDGNKRLKAQSRTTVYRGITVGGVDFDIVTSQPGSARGWSAGLIDWDELLTQNSFDMWEALAPTQSAQRSPLMLLTSTAGHADSIVLRAFYDRLVRQAKGDEKPDPTFYGAWWQSENPDAGLDWRQVGQANPALGDGRLTRQAIASDFSLLPADSWRRERLNHWVDARVEGSFRPGQWAACRLPSPLEDLVGPFALGIDVQPGWERATVTVAGLRADGRVGVEVYRDIRADAAAPVTGDRIIEVVRGFPAIDYVMAIAYDQVSGAAPAFVRAAMEDGLPWEPLKANQVVAACMDLDELVVSGRLAVDDPLLDAQIPMAGRRAIGFEGAFRFSRKDSPGPIDAVLSMTFAAHAIAGAPPAPSIT